MTRAIFIHLPKTAGTSFHDALRQGFGTDAVSPPFSASHLSTEEAQVLRRYEVVCGHISIQDINTHFPDAALFTILRAPVDRCISWYFFAKNIGQANHEDVIAANNYDIAEFFNLDKNIIYRNIFNRQVRQLASHALTKCIDMPSALQEAKTTLEKCVWVGRYESLENDMSRLGKIFPEMAEVKLPNLNKTNQRMEILDLDPVLKQRIESYNLFDIALYDFSYSLR